ncbi:MAG: hypothetical protein IPG04_22695 [Polyangiaceae bacterium]|nr:hypothetical protein [Polyangiaceae bacterium]
MNDDDDTGGGTLVIQPSPTGPAQHPYASAHGAGPPAAPTAGPADLAPTPTQILPITDLPSGPSAPLPAAGRPPAPPPAAGRPPEQPGSFRPATTLALPPGALPPAGLAQPPSPRFESQPPPGHGGASPAAHHPASHGYGYAQPGAHAQGAVEPAQPLPPYPAQSQPPPQPLAPRPAGAAGPMIEGPTVVTRKSATGVVLAVAGFVAIIGLGIAGTLWVLNRAPAGDETSDDDTTTKAPSDGASSRPSATTDAPPTPAPPPTASAIATAPPTPPSTPTSAVPEPPPSAAAKEGPEADALAALEKLRAAVDHCTKNGTHVLPGTSPPIPSSFAKLKSGPYTPVARDFDASFFHCAQLRFDKPMSFAIQWQLDEPSWRGTGIVWIDTNSDGEIDQAYSFYAQLKKKDEVQFAPPQRLDDPKKRSLIPR